MRTLFLRIAFSAVIIHMWGCASRVAPDGGPKDTEPPIVLKTTPDSFSINSKPSKLEFEFNEFVQLKDGGTGILISPPMEKRPEAVLQGKTLVLKLIEPLEEETTYSVTVSKSIADLTENNPLNPYTMVFSTGNMIDSLSCSGKIIDAFSGKPLEGVYVLLYDSNEDSLPKTTLPRYFGITDKQGNYSISNIKENKYTIFALDDKNTNYLYDQAPEAIGFIDNEVTIDLQKTEIPLIRLSNESPKAQRLIKSSLAQPFTLELKYALAPDSLNLTDFNGSKIDFYKSPSSTNDSLLLHLNRVEDDSLKLYVSSSCRDTLRIDTLMIKVKQQTVIKQKRTSTKSDTSLTVTTNIEKAKLLPNEPFKVITNYPSVINDTLKTYWRIENDTTDALFTKGESEYEFISSPPLAPGRSVELVALPGFVKDIYGRRSDTLKIDFRRMDVEETGNIEILFEDFGKDNANLIIEVLDPKSKVIQTSSLQKNDTLKISGLNPGSYSLRIIEDLNSNGVWDPANYDTRTQAEQTFHYPNPIAVRAGWDIAVEWIIRKPKEKIE